MNTCGFEGDNFNYQFIPLHIESGTKENLIFDERVNLNYSIFKSNNDATDSVNFYYNDVNVFEKWTCGFGFYDTLDFVHFRFEDENDYFEWIGCLHSRRKTFDEYATECFNNLLKKDCKIAEIEEWYSHLTGLEKWMDLSEKVIREIYVYENGKRSMEMISNSIDEDITRIQSHCKNMMQNFIEGHSYLENIIPSKLKSKFKKSKYQDFIHTNEGFKKIQMSKCKSILSQWNHVKRHRINDYKSSQKIMPKSSNNFNYDKNNYESEQNGFDLVGKSSVSLHSVRVITTDSLHAPPILNTSPYDAAPSNAQRPRQRHNIQSTPIVEPEDSPIRQALRAIISKYFRTPIQCTKVLNQIYSLGIDGSVTLNEVIEKTPAISRPSMEERMSMLQELQDGGLINISKVGRSIIIKSGPVFFQ